MSPHTNLLALSLAGAASLGCNQLTGSPEPMGDPIALGEACAMAPEATGVGIGDVSPNLVGTDQYGELIDLYADLCDRHVVIVRAGFD